MEPPDGVYQHLDLSIGSPYKRVAGPELPVTVAPAHSAEWNFDLASVLPSSVKLDKPQRFWPFVRLGSGERLEGTYEVDADFAAQIKDVGVRRISGTEQDFRPILPH